MPMKHAVVQALHVSGAFDVFRLANRRKILILAYHRFSDRDRDRSTSARAFTEQLAYLRARYAIVSLSSVQHYLSEGRHLPDRAAVITIDDGYHDAYEVAFPILRRFGAPAAL